MIWVDIPTAECFEDDDAHCEAAWKNLKTFATMAEAVKFLRYHLGETQVTDEGFVKLATGEDEPCVFCANCEAPAVAKVTHHDNSAVTSLCQTCQEAYEWGQASPGSTVEPLDSGDDDESDGDTDEADYEGTGCGRGDFPAMNQRFDDTQGPTP